MKIGWHIWKPATCWLQQERGGGGTPGLMSNGPEKISLKKVLHTKTQKKKKTRVKKAPYIQEDRYRWAHAWGLH